MSSFWTLLAAHQTIVALVAYYIISAAIGALPAPAADSGNFYKWFFQFSNTLAGNLTRAFSSKLPGGSNAATPAPSPAKP